MLQQREVRGVLKTTFSARILDKQRASGTMDMRAAYPPIIANINLSMHWLLFLLIMP